MSIFNKISTITGFITLGISAGIYIYTRYKYQLKLDQFDLHNIIIGDNIFIIGKKNTGKSTLISKITNYFKDIPISIIINPTETLERFYKDKNVIVNSSYRTDIIANFIQNQKDNINSHIIEDNEAFIILDNCLLDTELNDLNLTDLLINGYFYRTINIISSAITLSNSIKTNVDYLFMFKDTHNLNKTNLYQEYFSTIVDYEEYNRLFNLYTKDHQCIVIDFKNGGKLYYF